MSRTGSGVPGPRQRERDMTAAVRYDSIVTGVDENGISARLGDPIWRV